MNIRNPGFIKALLERNLLSRDQLDDLRKRFPDDDGGICRYVIQANLLEEVEAGEMWSTGFGLAWMALRDSLFQADLVARLPRSFAHEHKLIPIYKFGDRVTAAVANPMDRIAIDRAEQLVREKFSLVCAFQEDIDDAIEIQYGSVDGLQELSEQVDLSAIVAGGGWEINAADLKRIAGDRAVVELVRAVLLLGVKESASDIHISPQEGKVMVRFRVDGILRERLTLGLDVMPAVAARIKVLTDLNLAERRRPQDGRSHLDLANRRVDIRVSVVPTMHGERIVLRLLGDTKSKGIPKLDDLALARENYQTLRRIIHAPSGIVFVVGPTGSGKTTTLFSALKAINRPEINILTIEDPIEYRLDGASQLQINNAIGLDFKNALRAYLRQDPDILLVGEIRDQETAEIAVQAALTGHLVLSTLHANTALQAVTRMVDLGVEAFNVAPAMIGVLSQRLVRRLCDHCKEPYPLPEALAERIFVPDGKPVTLYRAVGCPTCDYQGYRGRLALHELLEMDDYTREVLVQGGGPVALRDAAEKSGFQDIGYDGLKKVLRGQTTLDEVQRVTFAFDIDLTPAEEEDEEDAEAQFG